MVYVVMARKEDQVRGVVSWGAGSGKFYLLLTLTVYNQRRRGDITPWENHPHIIQAINERPAKTDGLILLMLASGRQ
jgi:hypothetical protein